METISGMEKCIKGANNITQFKSSDAYGLQIFLDHIQSKLFYLHWQLTIPNKCFVLTTTASLHIWSGDLIVYSVKP